MNTRGKLERSEGLTPFVLLVLGTLMTCSASATTNASVDPSISSFYPDTTASANAIIPLYQDIAIINITGPEMVVRGTFVAISVTLENQGDLTENFTLYANFCLRRNLTLAPKSSTTIIYSSDTSSIPLGNYTLWVYVPPCFGDQDPYDNIYVDGVLQVRIVVSRSYLMERLAELDMAWPYASPKERTVIFREIVDIDGQWPYAPP